MPRYFIELSYQGDRYRGFQVQQNANTIQAEVEKALGILSARQIELTGSSRTDAGVHARQNFFHFDSENEVQLWRGIKDVNQFIYKINAVLPEDICVKSLRAVPPQAHCRFDAVSREYRYYIYQEKDPFLRDRAYYFPYKLEAEKMQEVAGLLKDYTDFTSFSKRNTQVKSFYCTIYRSEWVKEGKMLVYIVKANRFLRGMVRALVATQLKVGRRLITPDQFCSIIEAKDAAAAFFSAPARGLFLEEVSFPDSYFD